MEILKSFITYKIPGAQSLWRHFKFRTSSANPRKADAVIVRSAPHINAKSSTRIKGKLAAHKTKNTTAEIRPKDSGTLK